LPAKAAALDDAKKQRGLEEENRGVRTLVADLTLDNQMLTTLGQRRVDIAESFVAVAATAIFLDARVLRVPCRRGTWPRGRTPGDGQQ